MVAVVGEGRPGRAQRADAYVLANAERLRPMAPIYKGRMLPDLWAKIPQVKHISY
jgi:hypothetical protein